MGRRLIFLYHAQGQAAKGSGLPWNPDAISDNDNARHFKEEGYFHLFKRLLEEQALEEVLIVVESVHGAGYLPLVAKMKIFIMPEISYLKPYLKPGDIIFCRGGHRSWHDFLAQAANDGHKLMLYGANTGRERWPFWNAILDDLTGKNILDCGRIIWDFRKPINQQIFYPQEQPQKYDLCLGASHIHDKKGQWQGIKIAAAFKHNFGLDLKIVMPGDFRHGEHTDKIKDEISRWDLKVDLPGMAPRVKLCEIFNQSRFFLHLGGGQGDRSVIEALACGCYPILGYPERHHPAIQGIAWPITPSRPTEAATLLKNYILRWNSFYRSAAAGYFTTGFDLETAVLPRFIRLFNALECN